METRTQLGREIGQSLLLLAMTALISGGALGVGLLAIRGLG